MSTNKYERKTFTSKGFAYIYDLKDYENSFIYLDKANSILRQQINYNILNDEKLINKIIKLFQKFNFDKINKKPIRKKIVFI